ncbi:MAG: GNAT family N-acetyltransferase [Bacteroidetes bacterium]|nr:GNAT family N-acetyltransferase [Bacteroidota bacterium]
MIDHPRPADEAALRLIWREVFNDTGEFIDSFFGRRYSADTALVYRTEGIIASMIFFPGYDFKVNDSMYRLGYICGAATLPGQRQKGLMGRLLEASLEVMRSRGDSFSALVPASDSLYEYYRRFGYREIFFRKRFSLERRDIKSGGSFSLEPMQDYGTLYRLYVSGVSKLPVAVIHSFESYRVVTDEFMMTGGQILVSSDHRLYCFVRVKEGTVSIREMFGEPDTGISYHEVAGSLLEYYPEAGSVHAEAPAVYEGIDSEHFRTGMARGLHNEADIMLKNITGAYMKFMLEE